MTGVLLNKSVNQSVSANDTAISFDVVVYDDHGLYDPAEPTKITIPAELDGARVQMGCQFSADGLADGTQVQVGFYRNGNANGIHRSAQQAFKLAGSFRPSLSLVTPPFNVDEGDEFLMIVSIAGTPTYTARALNTNFWLRTD